MWIIIASLLVLGCVIFIAVTLLGYTSHAASLKTQLDDIRHAIDHKTQRWDDYRVRAEELQDAVPILTQKVNRLKQWISALNKQKLQLKTTTQSDGKSSNQRDAAIRRGMAAVQKRKA
ncbi:MAG: small-conductance mechanosensitive channel [Candidatus Latescibacterota bacterium]|jgi:small-conductance mechanosensitive channel